MADDARAGPQGTPRRKRQTCWKALLISAVTAIGVIAMVVFVGMRVMVGTTPGGQRYPWPIPHEFTSDELAKYTGSDGGDLIMISILGHVYDVSAAPEYYGPNGSYR